MKLIYSKNKEVAIAKGVFNNEFCKKILKAKKNLIVKGSSISNDPSLKETDTLIYESVTTLFNDYMKKQQFWPNDCIIKDSGYHVVEVNKLDKHVYVDKVIPGATLLIAKMFLEDKDNFEIKFLRQGFSIIPNAGDVLFYPPYWTHPYSLSSGFERSKIIITEFYAQY